MENRIITVVILILFVLAIAWFGGCFDSESPPPDPTYLIAGGGDAPLVFSALTDSQQSEVVELVRRSMELQDLRKLNVQILKLHVSLIVKRVSCPDLREGDAGARMDTLLASILQRMTVGTRLLDSIDPRLELTRYAESVEKMRALQKIIIGDCGAAVFILLETGCAQKDLREELPEFSQRI